MFDQKQTVLRMLQIKHAGLFRSVKQCPVLFLKFTLVLRSILYVKTHSVFPGGRVRSLFVLQLIDSQTVNSLRSQNQIHRILAVFLFSPKKK